MVRLASSMTTALNGVALLPIGTTLASTLWPFSVTVTFFGAPPPGNDTAYTRTGNGTSGCVVRAMRGAAPALPASTASQAKAHTASVAPTLADVALTQLLLSIRVPHPRIVIAVRRFG